MKGYQLKITLKGTSPPVWRRIWIPADMTFRNLHEAIQYLFGWMDFEIAREHVKILCDDGEAFEFERDTVFKDMDTPLHTYLKEKMKLVYTYDYGDNWEHVILVEKQSEEAQSQIKLLKWKQDNLAEDAGLAGRVEVWDIQQFLSANVYEHSLFDEAKRNSTLSDIISRYNNIILETETDPSLHIEFEAK